MAGMLSRLRQAAAHTAEIQAKERARAKMPGATGVPLQFAFVDVETTGLDPRVDRIVEIALVVTDAAGHSLDEFTTLVRPEGLGRIPTAAKRVNLIEERWLAASPTTRQVLPEVTRRLHGRVIVGHNARFDVEFIQEEMLRTYGMPREHLGDWTTMCTVDLCRQVDLPRRLADACYAVGINYEKHSALGDTQATARLLHHFMGVIDPQTFAGAIPSSMPTLHPDPAFKPVVRQHAEGLTEARPVLDRLIASLPPDLLDARSPEATDAYMTELQTAVADGYISPEEIRALEELATRHGLTGSDIRDIHQELVMGMLDAALDDGRITKDERDEVQNVALWLGVDLSDWTSVTKAAKARRKAGIDAFRAEMNGSRVAFTGAGLHPANIREALCLKHGIHYATTVNDATGLLVVGTANTDTILVGNARERGLPTMVESTFWRRLGEG